MSVLERNYNTTLHIQSEIHSRIYFHFRVRYHAITQTDVTTSNPTTNTGLLLVVIQFLFEITLSPSEIRFLFNSVSVSSQPSRNNLRNSSTLSGRSSSGRVEVLFESSVKCEICRFVIVVGSCSRMIISSLQLSQSGPVLLSTNWKNSSSFSCTYL